MIEMFQQIEQRVSALPGVKAASFASFMFAQGSWNTGIRVTGVLLWAKPPSRCSSTVAMCNLRLSLHTGEESVEMRATPATCGAGTCGLHSRRHPGGLFVHKTRNTRNEQCRHHPSQEYLQP